MLWTRRSGKVAWSFPTQDRVSSSPVVLDGVVFVGSWDGGLYAVDGKTGVQKWKFQTGQTSDSRITAAPALAPDTVLVTSHNGSLFCLNASNGALRWQFKTGGKIFATPLVMGSCAYFGSWDKKFYAVDLVTGKEKWRYNGAEFFSVSAAGANNRVFVENDDLKMYCLDAGSGKVLWKTPMNSPHAFSFIGSCYRRLDALLRKPGTPMFTRSTRTTAASSGSSNLSDRSSARRLYHHRVFSWAARTAICIN